MELFWAHGSPYSWRAALALQLKGAPWESRILQMSQGELRQPTYLALNPRGKIPSLRDGDVVVPESLAIVAYLDRVNPEPPLFGANPAAAAEVWRWVADCTAYLDERMNVIAAFCYFGWGALEPAQAAVEGIQPELRRAEDRLALHDWLAGDGPSAAECFWYPTLATFRRAASKEPAVQLDRLGFAPVSERWPAIARWMARVESLPGFEETWPSHWGDIPS